VSQKERAEELAKKRSAVKEMGGAERIAKQHARNKLTARERIEKLFDPGSFLEMGIHAPR